MAPVGKSMRNQRHLLDDMSRNRRGGVSARQFAKMAGLNPKTFSSWVLNWRWQKEFEEQGWVGRVKPVALLEPVVEERGSVLVGGEHTPSLPDARPGSDRFQCGGRESKFLAGKD